MQDIFSRARNLRVGKTRIKDLDLGRIHTNAKNAIFMIEGLDAAVRVAEMALIAQRSLPWEEYNALGKHTTIPSVSNRIVPIIKASDNQFQGENQEHYRPRTHKPLLSLPRTHPSRSTYGLL